MGLEVVVVTDRLYPPEFLLDLASDFVKVDMESPSLYLNPQLMVKLALESGCDSLHPGFGFLSENSAFAAMVQRADMTWVGPSPEAISSMASKETARNRAVQIGVPIVPGLAGFSVGSGEAADQKNLKILEDFARKTGFPLLLKAALGGGGKGMRRVNHMEELFPAAQRASSEALSSFGDGTLICERYIETPRHVEVQVLGDHHGQVITIGDRDCSLQRRHQKIIEEAPAPDLNPATRAKLHQAAVALAKSVQYYNAGTIEFLVDWSHESQRQAVTPFYFLEMNTRLQVEHPVTEEVYGLDLVEWQIRVARGEKLAPDLFERTPRGHSIEVRIYAEDPSQNYMPAPGILAHFTPASGRGVRWELGLDSTDGITGHFDPMIAKLITTAASRQGALRLCDEALRQTFLAGPANNTAFLRTLLAASAFRDGPQSTGFLGNSLDTLLKTTFQRADKVRPQGELILSLLPGALRNQQQFTGGSNRFPGAPDPLSPRALTSRLFGASGVSAPETSGKTPQIVICTNSQKIYRQDLQTYTVQFGSGQFRDNPILPSGKPLAFWYASLSDTQTHRYWVQIDGENFTTEQQVRKRSSTHAVASNLSDCEIQAPVPGKIVSLSVVENQKIEAGAVIAVLESMKMEFEIKAPQDLVIQKINAKPGDQVSSGQNFIEFLPWTDKKG